MGEILGRDSLMLQLRARLTNILLAGVDSTLLLVVFFTVLRQRVVPEAWAVAIRAFAIFFPICLAIFFILGLYNSRRTSSCFSDLLILTKGFLLATFLLYPLNLLFLDRWLSLNLVALLGVIGLLALASSRVLLRFVLRRLREHGFNRKKLALVGLSPWVDQILEEITTHLFFGYEVIAIFGPSVARQKDPSYRGGIDDFIESLDYNRPDEVIIALPFELSSRLPDLIRACELQGVQAKVIESLASSLGMRGHLDNIGGIRLVSAHTYLTERLDYVVFKRLFDVAASFSLLVLLTPLMLLIALGVRFSSKGPVFFRQRRVGLNGKRFWIVKFRTMTRVEDVVSDTEWMPNDHGRFTRFGTFLRRTNLDELPQLLNVFMGQMSLVGPRPERPFYTERFKKEVPQYMVRHYIHCGMTGWAQINGWRGNTSIQRRVEHDLYYLRNWGFWFDIKILVFTLFRGLYHRRAYW